MDIKQEEWEILTNPNSMFVYAIKSPPTRKKYEGTLTKFFDSAGIGTGETLEARCTAFEQKSRADPNLVTPTIITFLQGLKQRVETKEISGATIRNYVKAIKLFCEMNEILVPWKKIMRGIPRSRSFANDRAPTIED